MLFRSHLKEMNIRKRLLVVECDSKRLLLRSQWDRLMEWIPSMPHVPRVTGQRVGGLLALFSFFTWLSGRRSQANAPESGPSKGPSGWFFSRPLIDWIQFLVRR